MFNPLYAVVASCDNGSAAMTALDVAPCIAEMKPANSGKRSKRQQHLNEQYSGGMVAHIICAA